MRAPLRPRHAESSSSAPCTQITGTPRRSVSATVDTVTAAAADPVGHMEFEVSRLGQPEQRHHAHLVLQRRRQTVDEKRQHVGAERIADQDDAPYGPLRQVVANDARQIRRGGVRRARRPVVAKAAPADGRNSSRGHFVRHASVHPGPAAVACQDDRHRIRPCRRRHRDFGQGQVAHLRRSGDGFGVGAARRDRVVGGEVLRLPVARTANP